MCGVSGEFVCGVSVCELACVYELQCIAVHAAVCCSIMHSVAVCCSLLKS